MRIRKSPGALAAHGASEIDIRSRHVISIINHRQDFWQLSNASQSVRSPASETERSYACVQTYLPEKRRVVCIDPYAPVKTRLRRLVQIAAYEFPQERLLQNGLSRRQRPVSAKARGKTEVAGVSDTVRPHHG